MSLFASRQTLLLLLPENGPNAAINEQLLTLTGLLHDDLLLIVRGNKLSKAQENAARFTALANRSVQVTCQTPEQAQLPAGLLRVQKQLNLELMTLQTKCSATVMKVTCWRWPRHWSVYRCSGQTAN